MAKPTGDISEVTDSDPGICAPDGIAVGGYDLLTYHGPDGPKPGNREFAEEYDGLTYLFVSDSNRQRFRDAPKRHLPRYDGWCAITLALGRLTCPDYQNFQIEDGDLLLFEVTGFTNGKVLWNTDAPGYRIQADDNFKTLLRKK